jgi:hypothetical protein
VRIIDIVKRAALSRLLLENTLSATPGEKLDEKLASLVLPDESYSECLCCIILVMREAYILLVPPPSSDDDAWWNRPGKHVATNQHTCSDTFSEHPNGIFPISIAHLLESSAANPFDSPEESPFSSSPSSSDEELYSHAMGLQSPITPVRKPPPPPPRSRYTDV